MSARPGPKATRRYLGATLKRPFAKASKARRLPRSAPAVEWIGGRTTAPFFVHDRAEPYHPGLALWVELPKQLVVGHGVFTPGQAEGALARTLRGALAAPDIGRPRQPASIRVADEEAAAEIRNEIGGDIPVVVGPTPELDDLFEDLIEAFSQFEGELEEEVEEPGYLDGGFVSPPVVEALFAASGQLFARQPWTMGEDPPLLQLDIPSLGVDGACVAITGQSGETRGLLIFPSIDHFKRFHEAAAPAADDPRLETIADLLALSFESAADVPPEMRREAMQHEWRVVSADAYPILDAHDREGLPRPLAVRDLQIATHCAESLAILLNRHPALLEDDSVLPVCESYFEDDGTEVRLTVPCGALELFDLEDGEPIEAEDDFEWSPEPGPFRPRAGRNEPCPCGSGRKYKKCHMPVDEARHATNRKASAAHRMDVLLIDRLADFAERELGAKWRKTKENLPGNGNAVHLTRPWAIYSVKVDGRTVVDAYLESRRRRSSQEELAWLEAQRAAWLSVWEVEDVNPGETVALHDLLSGERRMVREILASRSLNLRDAVLARVLDHDGLSLLAGVHAIPLPPFEAADVVDRARARLRRKGAVPVERLRDPAFGRSLMRYWEEAVEEVRLRSAQPPELRNRDGDLLLVTVDRFDVVRGAREEVEDLVAALEGVVPESDDDERGAWVFLESDNEAQEDGRKTVLGWLRVRAGSLRIETNSQARADALRARVEAACGSRIRHRIREHSNPLPPAGHTAAAAPPPPRNMPSLSPEDEARASVYAAEHKAKHYAAWPDLPLPALNQRTPRECARTAAGRREVDLVLKHMENMEHRAGGPNQFDFSTVREELGINPR